MSLNDFLCKEERRIARFRATAVAFGYLLCGVGLMVLLGYAFELRSLTQIVISPLPMKANTALCLVLSGLAVVFLNSGHRRAKPIFLLVGTVALVALLTAIENWTSFDLGIDELLYRQHKGDSVVSIAGRMSAMTAVGLLASSVAIALTALESRSRVIAAQILALLGAFTGLVAIVGYTYGVDEVLRTRAGGSISRSPIHSALALLVLHLAILISRPRVGPMSAIVSSSAGGTAARRLLPGALTVPFVIGWLRQQGELNGFYDTWFGLALFATSNVILFTGIIWTTAVFLNRTDDERRAAASEALAQAHRRQLMLQTADDGICLMNARYEVVETNESFARMLGCSPSEALRLSLWDWDAVYPSREKLLERWPEIPLGHQVYQTKLKHRNGSVVDVEISHNGFDLDGDRGLLCICRDITERIRAQEALRSSEERFRLMISNVEDYAIYMLNPEGKIASWNEGAARINGFSAEEILGRDHSMFFTDDERCDGRPRKALEQCRAEGRLEQEGWRIRKDGSRFWGNVIMTPLYGSEHQLIGFGVITRDLTVRRNAEEQIRKMNLELERRVAERTAELVSKSQQLEAFCYSVSHDLKAPLRAIDGYSRLLQEDYGAQLVGDASSFLANVRKATTQMNALIEDLLAYSKLERRSLNLVPINLAQFVDKLIASRVDTLGRVNLQVGVGNASVLADPDGLAIALRNLLDNAVKFSSHREQPEIAITATIIDDHCRLSVKDNGTGFDMRYHEKMFEIFQRLHTEEAFEGTGIGLAMVRKAVERSNGRVWAESQPGNGATFYLELPLAKPNSQPV